MKRPLALSCALACLLLATGCQQAVRPNLAALGEPTPASPAPAAGTDAAPIPATSQAAVAAEAAQTDAPADSAANPKATNAKGEPGIGTELAANGPALSSGADVFARINRGLSPDACSAGNNMDRWRHRYASYPASFAGHLEDVLPLLDFVSREVERTGLPMEFVFIPLVESWYRPGAVGPGGPAGMWQMISSTARNHGIHIKAGYDGRLSPVESTRAALSYLKTLQGMFGNWQAIVMAYNAGEGRMMGAFKRARTRDVSAARRQPHGLSNITYDYVAKLQALSCLVSEPARHGLQLPGSSLFVPLVATEMEADISSLEQFARRQGRDPAQLRQLNPGFKGGRVVAGVPRLALMPSVAAPAALASIEAGNEGAIALAEQPEPELPATGTHEVQSGETLWSIARRHGLSIDQLRDFNRLKPDTILHPGQRLKLAE